VADPNDGDEPNLADPGGDLIARTPELRIPEDQEFPPRKREFPAFEQLGAFLQEDLPTPPELVKGLLHKGSKIVLGGGSKSYKTWLLSDLAISIASGIPWVGFETTQARVLYVNLELGRPWFQRRLINILEKKGLERIGEWITRLDLWNLRGYCTDGDTLLDELERRTEGRGYDLIIGDPLYKLLAGKKENSAEDMSGLFNRLEEISEKSGAASIYGTHFSKGNQAMKDPIDRVSGSGVFGRDPDTIITITPHKKAGAYTFEAITRNLPPVRPFVIRWDMPFFTRDTSLDPELLKRAKTGREKEFKPRMLWQVLVNNEPVRPPSSRKLSSKKPK
jgi:RecA-family ATPase